MENPSSPIIALGVTVKNVSETLQEKLTISDRTEHLGSENVKINSSLVHLKIPQSYYLKRAHNLVPSTHKHIDRYINCVYVSLQHLANPANQTRDSVEIQLKTFEYLCVIAFPDSRDGIFFRARDYAMTFCCNREI